jgi:hypothetical protein
VIQITTCSKKDTYFRYLWELRKQHSKRFIEQGDRVNDKITPGSQMLYDRLCNLYSLYVQRLTNNLDTISKDYSDTIKIAEGVNFKMRDNDISLSFAVCLAYRKISYSWYCCFGITILPPNRSNLDEY